MTLQQKVAGAFVPVGGAPAGDWTRPADWLTLPAVVAGDKKFVGLVAVWPGDSNWVSMTIAGAYTVDWGDGSAAQNVATGVQADHNILFASVAAGTLTTLGYRQALVTVTMQGAANLTSLNLNVDTVNTVNGATSLWLDIAMASANLTSLTVSGGIASSGALQRFEYVGLSSLASTASAFSTARVLREIVGTAWTASCTNFTSMFTGCSSLTTAPTLDTSAGLNFTGMFQSCGSLTTVELGALDTSSGTDFTSMFQSCSALSAVALDTSAGTSFSSLFASCLSLATGPTLNTSAGTNFTGMFSTCLALTAIPAYVVSAATTGYGTMFSSCPSLRVGAMSGTKLTISYASCALSATALDAIYTGLATVTAKTITVSGNWGVAGDTPTLATDKGWSVTG